MFYFTCDRSLSQTFRKQEPENYKEGRTYVEFLEQGSVRDGCTVLLNGLPELFLSRVAIHWTDLEPAICIHAPITIHHQLITLATSQFIMLINQRIPRYDAVSGDLQHLITGCSY